MMHTLISACVTYTCITILSGCSYAEVPEVERDKKVMGRGMDVSSFPVQTDGWMAVPKLSKRSDQLHDDQFNHPSDDQRVSALAW